MKRTFVSLCMIAFLIIPLMSCSEKAKNYWDLDDSTNEIETPVEANPAIVALGWEPATTFGELPDHLKVYKSPSVLESKNAIAYIAVADMKKANFSVLGEKSGYKTPTEFYTATSLPIILNAGFFWDGASLSLICRDGQVVCPNSQTASQDWVTIYYPTRGAFCLNSDGTYEATWTYTTSANVTYAYPQPAENKYGEAPQSVPSDSYPSGAKVLAAKTAIGGGPVLLKQGVIKDTYINELFEIGADSSQPRSAVGITSDKKMIFFVCEGRNMTTGVPGLTTKEVAKVLKDLGCIEALNLDGGGSSCMLINGQETIKGSDGKQRKVVTAIGLN